MVQKSAYSAVTCRMRAAGAHRGARRAERRGARRAERRGARRADAGADAREAGAGADARECRCRRGCARARHRKTPRELDGNGCPAEAPYGCFLPDLTRFGTYRHPNPSNARGVQGTFYRKAGASVENPPLSDWGQAGTADEKLDRPRGPKRKHVCASRPSQRPRCGGATIARALGRTPHQRAARDEHQETGTSKPVVTR